ncbi:MULTISPECIES: N-6 DNA methylase [unclassified Streptomyces]|uniref:type I restriction-modification system subunit M n=1 Tax=unclassified Streptomyces TaxID=2593676 RepID=UPI0034147634
MALMTVRRLTEELFRAADILRGRMDASEYRDVLFGMLLLKRASDQPGILNVPDESRWRHIVDSETKAPEVLNKALSALKQNNPDRLDGVLGVLDFNKGLGHARLKALIDHFDRIPLGDDDLEFSDVVGRAYDHTLGWLADAAGKKGGEFYTPRSVVQLMVDLVRPEPGQSVYDPFAGSGGMLLQAKEYVAEYGRDAVGLGLFGQELNVETCSTARLNLLLHNVTDGSVLCGDTLADPLHLHGDGRLRRFDRVLTNAPFSMNYTEKEIKHPERMRYGWTPAQAKKADLMNVQHVLAVLRPDGIGAVVTPHGVLFRGGSEAEIRRGIVEEDRLEAVIGIGPNVFHGTSLPACILVLRGSDGTPVGERGTVLFINAEREVVTGRSLNRLEPENIEKIVSAFQERADIDGFSRVVTLQEIAENDFNLNIPRYVDAGPPEEPLLDVRAALFGGVPRHEVEAEEPRFHSFGIDLADLFQPRDLDYFSFPAEGCEATAACIPDLATAQERRFIDQCSRWWEGAGAQIAELAGTKKLFKSRSHLMASFREELLPLGIMDRYQLTGVFAAWWSDRQDDLRSLEQRGFPGVIDRWAAADGELSWYSGPARERVLEVLGDDLCSRVTERVAAQRQGLVALYRSWGDRYETSFADLEQQSQAATERLRSRLRGLGYR